MPLHDVVMPQNSMGDADGVVTEWLVAIGDAVVAGQELCAVETAKAVVEVEAPASGTLVEILTDLEAEVTAGDVLARIEEA